MKSCLLPVMFAPLGLFGAISAHTAEPEPRPGVSTSTVSGIDRTLFSQSVSPGENFYWYANQQWLQETDIPSDKSNYGIFTVLDDRTREQVRTLVETAAGASAEPGTPAQKVGDLYRSVTDLEARNAAGLEPIGPLLDQIASIDSHEVLAAVSAMLTRSGVYGPLAPYVSVDARASERYTVYLTQSGLTMPDRDYYLSDDERYQELREQLVAYVADLLQATGHSDPQGAAATVVGIETAIAQGHWTKTENRDPVKTYNRKTSDAVAGSLGSFDWSAFTDAAGFGELESFVVRQPSYLEALGDLFDETPLDAWKDYLTFRLLDAYASSLSESLEQRHFDFHAKALSGITEQEPLWKRAVGVTGSVLGELVGQLYVETHFAPEAKERMNELVENLKRAFEKRIGSLDWMGAGTQKQALEKLAMITTKIGYPDRWKDYEPLTIEDQPLALNMLAAAKFEYERNLDKLDGPVDREEWHMTPQTINAYYNPTMNEIVFPAAILQLCWFSGKWKSAAGTERKVATSCR